MGLFGKGKVGMNPAERPPRNENMSLKKMGLHPDEDPRDHESFARDVMLFFASISELENENDRMFDTVERWASLMTHVLVTQDPDKLGTLAASVNALRDRMGEEEPIVAVGAPLYHICKYFRAKFALKYLKWVENYV